MKPNFKDVDKELNVEEEVDETVLLDMDEQILEDLEVEEPTEDPDDLSQSTTQTLTDEHSVNETHDNLTSISMSSESSTNLNSPEQNPELVNMDRRGRIIKKPEWMKDFDTSTDYVLFNAEPVTWEIAQHNKWKAAVDKEMESLLENNTWTVVPYPKDKNIIESKWVLKIKSDGQYKARLVARGFQQNLDSEIYDNVFSLVAKLCNFRVLVSYSL